MPKPVQWMHSRSLSLSHLDDHPAMNVRYGDDGNEIYIVTTYFIL